MYLFPVAQEQSEIADPYLPTTVKYFYWAYPTYPYWAYQYMNVYMYIYI